MDPLVVAGLSGVLQGIFGGQAQSQANQASQAESDAINYLLSRQKTYIDPYMQQNVMPKVTSRLLNPPPYAGQWLQQAKALSQPSRVGDFKPTPLRGAFQGSGVTTTGA